MITFINICFSCQVNNLSFELAPETVKWIADTLPLHVNRAGAELKAVILCHSWQKTAYFAIAMYCLSIIGNIYFSLQDLLCTLKCRWMV